MRRDFKKKRTGDLSAKEVKYTPTSNQISALKEGKRNYYPPLHNKKRTAQKSAASIDQTKGTLKLISLLSQRINKLGDELEVQHLEVF